ncbi:MAG: cytidine deaminase [Atopobiaceae bacterium]|nr:cytidine deaminase [Atopobiaceae bacterium]
MNDATLIARALEARAMAYVPYSGFAVGAALLTKDGQIYTGCNIENAAYGPANCAERTAFFKAVSEGVYDFEAIAVVGGPAGKPAAEFCSPCGICRQVMREFCDQHSFRVILGKEPIEGQSYLLEELLPQGFGPENLGMPHPATHHEE